MSYHFTDQKECDLIQNCQLFCLDSFIALKNKRTVYGIMCKIERIDSNWQIRDANTYRPYKHTDISSLYH